MHASRLSDAPAQSAYTTTCACGGVQVWANDALVCSRRTCPTRAEGER